MLKRPFHAFVGAAVVTAGIVAAAATPDTAFASGPLGTANPAGANVETFQLDPVNIAQTFSLDQPTTVRSVTIQAQPGGSISGPHRLQVAIHQGHIRNGGLGTRRAVGEVHNLRIGAVSGSISHTVNMQVVSQLQPGVYTLVITGVRHGGRPARLAVNSDYPCGSLHTSSRPGAYSETQYDLVFSLGADEGSIPCMQPHDVFIPIRGREADDPNLGWAAAVAAVVEHHIDFTELGDGRPEGDRLEACELAGEYRCAWPGDRTDPAGTAMHDLGDVLNPDIAGGDFNTYTGTVGLHLYGKPTVMSLRSYIDAGRPVIVELDGFRIDGSVPTRTWAVINGYRVEPDRQVSLYYWLWNSGFDAVLRVFEGSSNVMPYEDFLHLKPGAHASRITGNVDGTTVTRTFSWTVDGWVSPYRDHVAVERGLAAKQIADESDLALSHPAGIAWSFYVNLIKEQNPTPQGRCMLDRLNATGWRTMIGHDDMIEAAEDALDNLDLNDGALREMVSSQIKIPGLSRYLQRVDWFRQYPTASQAAVRMINGTVAEVVGRAMYDMRGEFLLWELSQLENALHLYLIDVDPSGGICT